MAAIMEACLHSLRKLLNVVQAAPLRGRLRYEAGACHLVIHDHLLRTSLYQIVSTSLIAPAT